MNIFLIGSYFVAVENDLKVDVRENLQLGTRDFRAVLLYGKGRDLYAVRPSLIHGNFFGDRTRKFPYFSIYKTHVRSGCF